jgi:hypothetical protein
MTICKSAVTSKFNLHTPRQTHSAGLPGFELEGGVWVVCWFL